MNENIELMGYEAVYNYTQYSHDNDINVIPEKDFKKLVKDTFKIITDTLRETYGPYGSSVIISDQGETTTTKDGYNVFEALGFSHAYKRMVYLAIQKIISRVNTNVGDGTTSCMLLAEKIFNILNSRITTPEHRRRILDVISYVEQTLQDEKVIVEDRTTNGLIQQLTYSRMEDIIKMSANGDEDLVEALMDAFEPTENAVSNSSEVELEDAQFDEYELDDVVQTTERRTGKETEIIEIRNVVPNVIIDPSIGSTVTYNISYLPGDYRVRVNMGDDFAMVLSEKTFAKVLIYDHAFNKTDWDGIFTTTTTDGFVGNIILLARTFSRDFMDNEYKRYLLDCARKKSPVYIILGEIKGQHVQDEIRDLAAVLHTDVFTIHGKNVVDLNAVPVRTIQIYNKNALCFFDVGDVDENYLKTVKYARDNDTSTSLVKAMYYSDRINALSMRSKDTIITITASSSLEAKLASDKVDDCVAIVKSALKYGTVPNMLQYAHRRIARIYNDKATTDSDICIVTNSIMTAIEGLFDDIWKSKHDGSEDKRDFIKKELYGGIMQSYDIITDLFVGETSLNTSAQYDIEVVVAALSIVKYLLTSRALIFDAHLLPQVSDIGHYEQKY